MVQIMVYLVADDLLVLPFVPINMALLIKIMEKGLRNKYLVKGEQKLKAILKNGINILKN